jgi:hypothetical protein
MIADLTKTKTDPRCVRESVFHQSIFKLNY